MTFCKDWNNFDPHSNRVIRSQAEKIEKLQRDLKNQSMDFMTFYAGDETNKLPEGVEDIIDIYINQSIIND